MKKTCLIVGGQGFLGSYAVESLVGEGLGVRVFDRSQTGNADTFKDKVEIVQGSLDDQKEVEQALAGVTHVFHFASSTVAESATQNVLFDMESNLGGLLRLMEAARRTGLKKIIFISTGGAIYGVPKKLPIKEEHPTDPISAYGITKLAMEKYLKLYQHLYGIDYVVLRLSNPYGPRQSLHNRQGAIVHFLAHAAKKEPIEIWGDGKVVRDYFFARDLVPLFPKLLSDDIRNVTLNIGSGEGKNLLDLLKMIEKTIGFAPAVRYLESRKVDVPVNVLDASEAARILGWKAQTSLDAGIKATWDWIQSTAKLV